MPIGATLITLALCAGSYLLDPPPPWVERLAGARGPIHLATVPARTYRRLSGSDRESYFSRSQPVDIRLVAESGRGTNRSQRLTLPLGSSKGGARGT